MGKMPIRTHEEHKFYKGSDVEITSEYDIVKFIGKVHSPIKFDNLVTSDMKLAKFTEAEREYILQQMKIASRARNLFSRLGRKWADRVFNTLTLKLQLMGVLGVNRKDNFLVTKFLNKSDTTDDDDNEVEVKPKKVKAKVKDNEDDEDE